MMISVKEQHFESVANINDKLAPFKIETFLLELSQELLWFFSRHIKNVKKYVSAFKDSS
jgi:hypothetical protein